MATIPETKSINRPLAAFKLKLERQKSFLRRFYRSYLPPTPGKIQLIGSLVLWASGVGLWLLSPFGVPTATQFPAWYLLILAATLTTARTCIAYFRKGRKE